MSHAEQHLPDRRPMEVFLDCVDRTLLEEVAAKTGASMEEVLRRGLRRLAEHVLAERLPGSSLDSLLRSLGRESVLREDLSPRHHDYPYGPHAG
jgi:hypothetical protein